MYAPGRLGMSLIPADDVVALAPFDPAAGWERDLATWAADVKRRGGYVVWVKGGATGLPIRAAHFGRTAADLRYEAPPTSVQLHDGWEAAAEFWQRYFSMAPVAVVETVVDSAKAAGDVVASSLLPAVLPWLIGGVVVYALARKL